MREVVVDTGDARLPGTLHLPPAARGVVVFAHGSGSGRHSPRNRYVARVLGEAGLGTLLLDLLEPREEADRANVFDIALLARRLTAAATFVTGDHATAGLPIGLFGASTGAAAALATAAELGTGIAAIVSRGGRPDLTPAPDLARVTAPTLLIVGGHDERVLALNRVAADHLTCRHELTVVPGATHLFEEPGTLEQVAALAADWYLRHLPAPGA